MYNLDDLDLPCTLCQKHAFVCTAKEKILSEKREELQSSTESGPILQRTSSTVDRIRLPLSHFLDEGFSLRDANYLLYFQHFDLMAYLFFYNDRKHTKHPLHRLPPYLTCGLLIAFARLKLPGGILDTQPVNSLALQRPVIRSAVLVLAMTIMRPWVPDAEIPMLQHYSTFCRYAKLALESEDLEALTIASSVLVLSELLSFSDFSLARVVTSYVQVCRCLDALFLGNAELQSPAFGERIINQFLPILEAVGRAVLTNNWSSNFRDEDINLTEQFLRASGKVCRAFKSQRHSLDGPVFLGQGSLEILIENIFVFLQHSSPPEATSQNSPLSYPAVELRMTLVEDLDSLTGLCWGSGLELLVRYVSSSCISVSSDKNNRAFDFAQFIGPVNSRFLTEILGRLRVTLEDMREAAIIELLKYIIKFGCLAPSPPSDNSHEQCQYWCLAICALSASVLGHNNYYRRIHRCFALAKSLLLAYAVIDDTLYPQGRSTAC